MNSTATCMGLTSVCSQSWLKSSNPCGLARSMQRLGMQATTLVDACRRLPSFGLAPFLASSLERPDSGQEIVGDSAVADKNIIKPGKKPVVILRRNGLESEP